MGTYQTYVACYNLRELILASIHTFYVYCGPRCLQAHMIARGYGYDVHTVTNKKSKLRIRAVLRGYVIYTNFYV